MRHVVIEGNRAVQDDEIIAGLATRPPEGLFATDKTVFDPVSLELDKDRIESYYKQKGYFGARVVDVKVTDVEAEEDPAYRAGSFPTAPRRRTQDAKVDVRITVNEGKPTRIRDIDLRIAAGDHDVDEAELREALGLTTGKRFDHAEYMQGKTRVKSRLLSAGYAHAEVQGEVRVDREDGAARVIVDVDPGPKAVFGKTRIKGLSRVPESAVQNRVTWKEGQVFDPRELDHTQGRLYQLGYFSTVGFNFPQEGRPRALDMTIDVTESSRHEVRLGGGVGVDKVNYEIRGRAGYSEKGFLDPLTTLRLEARPAYRFLKDALKEQALGGEASAALERDDLFWPLLRGRGEIAYLVQEFEAYSLQGPRVRGAVTRPFADDRLLLGLGYTFRFGTGLQVTDAIDPALREQLGVDGNYRLAFFDQQIAYDGRNDALAPSRGTYLELKVEEAGPFAGGAFTYTKVTPELRGYLSPHPRFVVAAKVRAGGLLWGKGELPITQRYFSGGASSQRGFSQRRLSPSVVDVDGKRIPIGGEALLETSVEARFDVAKVLGDNWLGVVTFLDGADVTPTFSELDPQNLHWAVGLGLRLRTIVGPIRLDFGYRITRQDDIPQEDNFAFHLSLGEAF